MSRISFFCTTMRRFFHRKTSQTTTRPGAAPTTPGSGGPPHRPRSSSSSSSTNSPVHGPTVTATGRVRAPNLRSRSMSVLNAGPSLPASGRKFTRSLSFCAENQLPSAAFTRQMTKSEEDEVFRTYTRRVYGLFGVLCAVIVGIAAYAYIYNYGNSGRRFNRSLSFCVENQLPSAAFTRQMTKSEEDVVFRTYTRRVYGLFGVLCAVIAAYAYIYNYGNR